MLSCLLFAVLVPTSWQTLANRMDRFSPQSSLPALPSEMKSQPPPVPKLVASGNEWNNDDVTEELRDPRNFGPPPTLEEIKKRREELDRERSTTAVPGLTKSASRLAQWLPDQDTPRQKAQEQLQKVKSEMQMLFGQGPAYAQQITKLGDLAIEAEVVPHKNAARELNYMDGKGNTDEFFDVDFNHPIDSTAIQKGVTALKETRQQHQKWTEEESQRKPPVQQVTPPQTPPGTIPNLRTIATSTGAAAPPQTQSTASQFAPRPSVLAGGVITRATIPHSPKAL
eukprot:c5260_g1_i1.p1 GENE.c5260_g1_i1~~c5260_g1_i1.p1  ORF type:complete len:283 (-),score=65.75 c5260_g1_i1:60-908(-)